MLYQLTRLLMTAALRLYYRRVYSTGVEIIPATGPVILLANHHASLMDAAFLGVLLKRPIHYFTRGDVFKNRLAGTVLHTLNMLPVFDHSGKNTLNHNEESFDKARNILLSGGVILFFPEGSSHIERKLKPLKKGAFRLAFQTYAFGNYKQDILLVPVGINYADPLSPDTDVLIHLDTPLLVSDYISKSTANASAATLQIKKDAEKLLLKNVLHIEDDDRLLLADICLEINRNDDDFFTTHWMQATTKRLEEEKNICACINEMGKEDANLLTQEATRYQKQLKQLGITDVMLSDRSAKPSKRKLMLNATFPLFALAWLLNALPVIIAKRLADTRVTRPDFYSWIFLTSAACLYCLWLIIIFPGFSVIEIKYGIAVTLITTVLGPYTLFYLNQWKIFRQENKWKQIKKENPALLQELKTLRNRIKEKVSRTK